MLHQIYGYRDLKYMCLNIFNLSNNNNKIINYVVVFEQSAEEGSFM